MQLQQELELIANELNGANDLAEKKSIHFKRIKSQELELNENMKWFKEDENVDKKDQAINESAARVISDEEEKKIEDNDDQHEIKRCCGAQENKHDLASVNPQD